MSDLKPCPFCGEPDIRVQGGDITCSTCGPYRGIWIAQWNRRAVDVEAVLKVAEEMQGLAERQVGRGEMVSFPFTWAAALRKACGK